MQVRLKVSTERRGCENRLLVSNSAHLSGVTIKNTTRFLYEKNAYLKQIQRYFSSEASWQSRAASGIITTGPMIRLYHRADWCSDCFLSACLDNELFRRGKTQTNRTTNCRTGRCLSLNACYLIHINVLSLLHYTEYWKCVESLKDNLILGRTWIVLNVKTYLWH